MIAFVQFQADSSKGTYNKNEHLVDFYDDGRVSFHKNFQMIERQLEETGIQVPKTERKKYKTIKVFPNVTGDSCTFAEVFKKFYFPRIKTSLSIEWVDVSS